MSDVRLFGTDGIRGEVGTWPLTPDTLPAIGAAIGRVLSLTNTTPRVLLGRDTRESGQFISASLSSGLLAAGVDVLDVGIITTPGIAFLTRDQEASAGIVISASHNPFRENGIKILGPDGFKLSDQQESDIERLTYERPKDSTTFGRVIPGYELCELYVSSLTDSFPRQPLAGLRVLMDCSNGAAYHIAPICFSQLGAESIVLNGHPTGININRECGSEHVRRDSRRFSQLIRTFNAHFGVAFDGDADRSIFVTPDGRLIDGDHLLAFFAQELKHTGRLTGNTVVASIMSNSSLEIFLQAIGVTLRRTPVGDRLVLEEMRKSGYVLGGEQAGHVIILDERRTTGDGIYTALLLATLVVKYNDLSLSTVASLIDKMPQVIASARIRSRPDLTNIPQLSEFKRLNRVNMRYSGTEPLFRAMVEGMKHDSITDVARAALEICKIVQHAADSDGGPVEILNCATGEYLDPSAVI